MTQKTVSGIIEWLKGWLAPINHKSSDTTYGVADESNYGHVIVEESPQQNSSNAVKSGGIYTALAGKSNTSHGHGNIDKDGVLKVSGTAQASKNVCTDANGKITAENKNNHSHGNLTSNGTLNSDTTTVNKVVVTDSNGNLKTISQLPQNKMNTSNFYLGTPQVVESSALSNLGTNAGADQFTINSAINEQIGLLKGVEFVKVVTTKPTASASTMNKLYVVTDNKTSDGDDFGIFVTYQSGTTYKWEQIDDAILKGFLTKSVADGYYASKSHAHLINSQVDNEIKVASGESFNNVTTLSQDTPLGIVLQAFGNAIGTAKTNAQVKDIQLIPKSTDATGAIKIIYNDE